MQISIWIILNDSHYFWPFYLYPKNLNLYWHIDCSDGFYVLRVRIPQSDLLRRPPLDLIDSWSILCAILIPRVYLLFVG